jgi:hypothetical protein
VQAKADVNAECDTALTDAGVATVQDVVDGVLDELTSDHTGAGSVSKAIIDILEDTGTTVPALIDALPTAAENAAVEVEVDEAAASVTIKRALQLLLAAGVGKSTSGTGTRQYRNLADTKDRVNAAVSSGDRSAVTKSYD